MFILFSKSNYLSMLNTIVNDNKLRSQVTCQPGVMKQILDGCCWLIYGFDNFKPTSGWIYHCQWKQRVCFGKHCTWKLKGTTRSSVMITLLGYYKKEVIFLAYSLLHCNLTCLTNGTWNNQYSTSCVSPGHVMVFLIVFSVYYSLYQGSILCLLSQWMKNIDLIGYLCNKVDHNLQYVVSNEIGISPFLLILHSWLCLFFEYQGSMHWDWWFNIVDADVFWSERSINTSSFLLSWISRISMSTRDKHLLQHFSFLGNTQMLLHILQEVNVSAKRGMKLLSHWSYYSYGL
jgi:hypothetical protein